MRRAAAKGFALSFLAAFGVLASAGCPKGGFQTGSEASARRAREEARPVRPAPPPPMPEASAKPEPSPTPAEPLPPLPERNPKGPLSGRRALLVVSSWGFHGLEYWETRAALAQAGVFVQVAASTRGMAQGTHREIVVTDVSIPEADEEDFDALVFVGGPGAKELAYDRAAHRLAADAVADGKLVAAICLAPEILARAGVLRGKRVTGDATLKALFREREARYTGAGVESDGRIVTAKGPGDAKAFARALVRRLGEIPDAPPAPPAPPRP